MYIVGGSKEAKIANVIDFRVGATQTGAQHVLRV
jgi:hypothetical protein